MIYFYCKHTFIFYFSLEPSQSQAIGGQANSMLIDRPFSCSQLLELGTLKGAAPLLTSGQTIIMATWLL
jgi:hypothetical protein